MRGAGLQHVSRKGVNLQHEKDYLFPTNYFLHINSVEYGRILRSLSKSQEGNHVIFFRSVARVANSNPSLISSIKVGKSNF
jgi:hypothetical protein